MKRSDLRSVTSAVSVGGTRDGTQSPKTTRLGDCLLKGNFVTREQLDEALNYQRVKGGRLGNYLIKLGYVTEDEIHDALSRQFDIVSVDLSTAQINADILLRVPRDFAVRHHVMPVRSTGNLLWVAMADPSDVVAIDELRFRTGCRIEPLLAREAQIREAIEKHYGPAIDLELRKVFDDLPETAGSPDNVQIIGEDNTEVDIEALKLQSEEAPIIRLVNFILADSIRSGASDVHIEPFAREMRIRFRIDGVLKNVMSPPVRFKDALTSRIKIMARLNISEKRVPQDGRIRIRTLHGDRTKEMDFRVSILPTLFGEKIVLRLLDRANLMLDMLHLGFEPESLEKFEKAIHKPFGMLLVT